MSRIGKKAIILPDKIDARIQDSTILIKGPNGQLSYKLSSLITIEHHGNELKLTRKNQNRESQALYGLSRTIVNNMVIGVSEGFNKKLENVGFSHPIIIKPPKGITIQVENNTNITISGMNKEIVGQTASKIRQIRPPEPYKGKGIRYFGEIVKHKIGKAGK